MQIKKIILPVILLLLHAAALTVIGMNLFSWEYLSVVKKVITASLYFAIAWLVIVLLDIGKMILIRHLQSRDNQLRVRTLITQLDIFEKIISAIVLFIATAAAFMNFEPIKQLGVSLFASAGIASVIVGLAAQRFISGIIAGIQIALTRPIRLDDMVVVENEWGWIEEINLTYVVVRTWDKRRLIVPASHFTDKPFQNWSRLSSEILAPVYIHTDYTVNVDHIREEVTRLLKDNALWDRQTNVVQVTNALADTMEIRVLASAKDGPTAWNLRVFLREKIIDFIRRTTPEALPRTRVHIENNAEYDSPQQEHPS